MAKVRFGDTLTTAELAGMAAPYNPRTISKHDLESLGRSMRVFGVVEPVVANKRSGRIVGGHQRVKAAAAEGIESLPVVWVDLDEPSEKQLNLALNRVSGAWDEDALAALLADLDASGADVELTGFAPGEIDELLASLGEPSGGDADPDDVPQLADEVYAQPGDVIALGEHRLACGDCRDEETVKALFGDTLAHAVITDPPYGVDYRGSPTTARDPIQNDGGKDLGGLLDEAFDLAFTLCSPGGAWYVFSPSSPTFLEFAQRLRQLGIWRQTLIWIKNCGVLGRADYHYQHELIFYGWKPGASHRPVEDRTQTTVWECDKPSRSDQHPTMKPVTLIERAMRNSTARRDVVYDPFLGSGTAIIAAEATGRRCFGIEIEPKYCDVIVRRWQEYTGKKAEGWRGNG